MHPAKCNQARQNGIARIGPRLWRRRAARWLRWALGTAPLLAMPLQRQARHDDLRRGNDLLCRRARSTGFGDSVLATLERKINNKPTLFC